MSPASRVKALPQSDSASALLEPVEAALRELELLCGRLERALMRRDWESINRAMADSRRATHALANAMEEAQPVRDAAFDEQVNRRLQRVHGIRENQLARLQQYHQAVGQRLQLVTRWKAAIKSLTSRLRARGYTALDQLT